MSVAERRSFINPCDAEMSVRRQCELLALSRSGYYRSLLPCRESEANEELMKAIDRQYIQTPFYGSRRMAIWLKGQGYAVNRKRVMRLMHKMGLEGLAHRRASPIRSTRYIRICFGVLR